jgi:hypothetical protein
MVYFQVLMVTILALATMESEISFQVIGYVQFLVEFLVEFRVAASCSFLPTVYTSHGMRCTQPEIHSNTGSEFLV